MPESDGRCQESSAICSSTSGGSGSLSKAWYLQSMAGKVTGPAACYSPAVHMRERILPGFQILIVRVSQFSRIHEPDPVLTLSADLGAPKLSAHDPHTHLRTHTHNAPLKVHMLLHAPAQEFQEGPGPVLAREPLHARGFMVRNHRAAVVVPILPFGSLMSSVCQLLRRLKLQQSVSRADPSSQLYWILDAQLNDPACAPAPMPARQGRKASEKTSFRTSSRLCLLLTAGILR